MEQLSTLSQTIMALNKKQQMIFRAKFAPRKCMPDKKLVYRKYKLIPELPMGNRWVCIHFGNIYQTVFYSLPVLGKKIR
jgi:hypothetical protein